MSFILWDSRGGGLMQKAIERKSLIMSSIINFIITGAGIWIFATTNIQALFVDCFFSLIIFISSILAVFISKVSIKKVKSYPDGLYFLEPLYAILKSLLILSLLGISTVIVSIASYKYFVYGIGEPMNFGAVLPYTISMTILCLGLSFFNKVQNEKIGNMSSILTVESKANFIDGIQSLGIGVAIICLYFIDINSSLGFLHFTGDFFITIILVLLSLKAPIKVIITSFRELSNGVICDSDMEANINEVVNVYLNDVSKWSRCDIFKVGMYIKVRIFLTDEVNRNLFLKLTQTRQKMDKKLNKSYENIEIVFVF